MSTNKRKVDNTNDDADAEAAKVPKLIPAAAEKKYLDTSDVINFCKLVKTFIEFCDLNDSNNDRVKTGFAENLASLTDIVDPCDIYHYMCPIALQLVMDPVAEVREAALLLINRQLRRLNSIEAWLEEEYILDAFVKRLVDILCHGVRWVQRQSFAILSAHIINSGSLGPTTFAQYFLSHLASLDTDKAPSVRIRVAQAFSFCRTREYYTDPSNPYHSILVDTITKLQNDADEDVKDMIMMKEKPEENKFENETDQKLLEKENVNKSIEPVSSASTSEIDKPPTKDEEIKRINDSGIEEVGPSPTVEKMPEKENVNKTTEPVSSTPAPTSEIDTNEEKRKVGKCCPQCGIFNEKWQTNRHKLTNCIVCNFKIDWPN